jgi:hypothetical protein
MPLAAGNKTQSAVNEILNISNNGVLDLTILGLLLQTYKRRLGKIRARTFLKNKAQMFLALK